MSAKNTDEENKYFPYIFLSFLRSKYSKKTNEESSQIFSELSVHKLGFNPEFSSFYSQISAVNSSLANNDLIQIEKGWLAEKGSPQLLPYLGEAVANIIKSIQEQVFLYKTKKFLLGRDA